MRNSRRHERQNLKAASTHFTVESVAKQKIETQQLELNIKSRPVGKPSNQKSPQAGFAKKDHERFDYV